MDSSLIIDNWLLHDIGSSLTEGLSSDEASEIIIDKPADSHSVDTVSLAGIQVEALLEFLTNIVFRDNLIVDANFVSAWQPFGESFEKLSKAGILRPLEFLKDEDNLEEPRKHVVDSLCVTSTLRKEQRLNEVSWQTKKVANDNYMSAVIWGTAGMLARSHVFEAPYSGHPLRKCLIDQTLLSIKRRDSVTETLDWIASEKLRVFETNDKKMHSKTAIVILPTAALQIIEESSNVEDLVRVAYESRDEYKRMREWMREIQKAVDLENPKDIAKYKKLLSTVSSDIDRSIKSDNEGQIELKIGIGLPSIGIKMNTLQNVMKKFGMRSMLNKQIMNKRGENSLRKLLKMFDENNSSIGLDVIRHMHIRGTK